MNRPKDNKEFKEGNTDFVSTLLSLLKKHSNKCGVMLSSSIQASLEGRYNGGYGISKKEAEDVLFAFSRENGNKV